MGTNWFSAPAPVTRRVRDICASESLGTDAGSFDAAEQEDSA